MSHFADKQEYLDAMLQYMPALHRQFIHDIRKGPSLREFGKICWRLNEMWIKLEINATANMDWT